jgi:P pilus assembly chaperone PapD
MARMNWRKWTVIAAGAFAFASPPADAAGDLLVAPTRIVLDGLRGTEVILNNIGNETATYRISLELRRMNPDGSFVDITPENANEREKRALEVISYAPRRVVLPPNQPQAIRVGVRAPDGLADGEYRAHLLFRAIPSAKPVVKSGAQPSQGVSISLTPIYGVTIPVIVRQGQLKATAGIADPQIVTTDSGPALKVKLTRTGTKSVYGRIRVLKPGLDKPAFEARGVAVYADNSERSVILPLSNGLEKSLLGPATVQYLDETDGGLTSLAEFKGVIR